MIKISEYKNPLANIDSFNPRMSISQVVRYFQRSNVVFTKSTIQNYVRIGLIPPPLENRYYLKNHLIMLAIISLLKDFYSLEQIKGCMVLINQHENLMEVYESFLSLYKASLTQIEAELDEINSATFLALMAKGIAVKQFIDKSLNIINQ